MSVNPCFGKASVTSMAEERQTRVLAMDVVVKRLKLNADRRNVAERRIREQKRPNNLRVRPDRRLNNIMVEWIPCGEIAWHPAVRESLVSQRKKKRMALQRNTYQAVLNIFKNKYVNTRDLRSVGDRRVHEQKLSFDRRVRPDRRLGNILVEWLR
jgi:hypothetical protein